MRIYLRKSPNQFLIIIPENENKLVEKLEIAN